MMSFCFLRVALFSFGGWWSRNLTRIACPCPPLPTLSPVKGSNSLKPWMTPSDPPLHDAHIWLGQCFRNGCCVIWERDPFHSKAEGRDFTCFIMHAPFSKCTTPLSGKLFPPDRLGVHTFLFCFGDHVGALDWLPARPGQWLMVLVGASFLHSFCSWMYALCPVSAVTIEFLLNCLNRPAVGR